MIKQKPRLTLKQKLYRLVPAAIILLNVGQEAHQSFTATPKTPNTNYDLNIGPLTITLYNNDDRTPIEIIKQIEENLLSIEEFGAAYEKDRVLTSEEKDELIMRILEEMANASNADIEDFIISPEGTSEGFVFNITQLGVNVGL